MCFPSVIFLPGSVLMCHVTLAIPYPYSFLRAESCHVLLKSQMPEFLLTYYLSVHIILNHPIQK